MLVNIRRAVLSTVFPSTAPESVHQYCYVICVVSWPHVAIEDCRCMHSIATYSKFLRVATMAAKHCLGVQQRCVHYWQLMIEAEEAKSDVRSIENVDAQNIYFDSLRRICERGFRGKAPS